MTHDEKRNDSPQQNNTSDDDASPERKGMTPRQMWEARQQEARGETEDKLNVQPINDSDQPITDEPAPGDSRETPQKAGEDTGPNSGHDPAAKLQDTSDELDTSDTTADTSDRTQQTPDKPPPTEHADNQKQEHMDLQPPDPDDDNMDSYADEGVRMVDNEKQPGMMKYPYATHGPPPADEIDEEGWEEKVVPSSLVLGILVIIGALLIGLALIAQQRRLNRLEERLNNQDRTISQILDRNE